MTFRASEILTVRGNEVGFTGAVPPGTLSRYFEWARWAMFRDPTTAEQVKLGAGVARAQHVTIREALRYPSTIRIDTTLGRLGRTSLDLVHRMVREDDGAELASARITIVQLGPQGPSPIDPSLASFLTPSDEPAALPFAEGEAAFETTILARPSDQDQFGHVNQARYVDFADDVRWIAAKAGHPVGFEGALGRISVDYRREVKAGTVLVARMSSAEGVRSLSLREQASGLETTRIALAPA